MNSKRFYQGNLENNNYFMGVCGSTKSHKNDKNTRIIISADLEHALLDRFGSGQIEMLRTKFKEYERNGGLDIGGFKKIMPYISKLPGDIIENAFDLFRNNVKDRISWMNFCATVSQYILGTRQEKCRFLYDVFDKKHQGMLTRDEISLLNKHLFWVLSGPIMNSVNEFNLLEKCLKLTGVLKFSDFRDWAILNIDLHKALQPFEIIPSAVSEKEMYLKCQHTMKIKGYTYGEQYYIISKKWMEAWKKYVRMNADEEEEDDNIAQGIRNRSTSYKSGARPIEISNTELIDSSCMIRLAPNLRENQEFEILCKESWTDFHKWYGGGPEIMRKCQKNQDLLYVDIYPAVLKVFYKKSNSSSLSKDPILLLVDPSCKIKATVDELKTRIKEQGEFCLTMTNSEKLIEFDPEKAFSEYVLGEINTCCFELASDNKDLSVIFEETLRFNLEDAVEYLEHGYWMSGIIRNISSTEYTIGASWHKRTIKMPRSEISQLRKPPMVLLSTKSIPFSTGLANIGNTCYMNSILQSFAHSPLINRYFTGESYADIKRRRGAHTKWKIVEEVENLLNELRQSKDLKIRPDRFYVEVTKVHPEFQGFEQHDSHEFLGILLNSLHEDLKLSNAVVPQTIILKGMSNEDERKVSQEQWEKYRGMHGSVISAICGGQTRNCLTCKNCTEKNTIFEVFTDFSVPIPIRIFDYAEPVIVVPWMSTAVQKVLVQFNKTDEIENFLLDLENKAKIKSNKFVFAFVKNSNFEEYFQPGEICDVFPKENFILHAFEVLTTIDEVERLGRSTIRRQKNSRWRQDIKINDLIDVNHKAEWVVGKVKEIDSDKIHIQLQTERARILLYPPNSENIGFYRYNTKSSNRILKIPLFHFKSYRKSSKFFGIPQVITIGSWYTWKNLLAFATEACGLFVDKKAYISKKVSFRVLKYSGRCVICKKHSCNGCEIPKTYENLESLNSISEEIYILATWVDEFYYKNVHLEDPDDTEMCSIFDCFSKYTEIEKIEKKCENCENSSHDSQIEIWRLPDILIIHLKRFSYNNSKLLKINHLVKFPLEGLDMSYWMLNSKKKQGVTMKTTKDNYLYDLYSVVNHTGGISGGHCTSFCKLEDGKWLFFDDDRVFQVTGDIEEEIVTKKAYILFYKRQRFRSGNVVKTMSLAR